MPGTFFPPLRVSDPDMHLGTCITYVPLCMPGSLTGGFLWSWWRGKRSRHSRRMRNPQFYVSGNRPMTHKSRMAPMCVAKHSRLNKPYILPVKTFLAGLSPKTTSCHVVIVGLRPVIQILCHVLARGWGRWLRYFTEAKAEVKYRASARIRATAHLNMKILAM